jgi:hypothetical protein
MLPPIPPKITDLPPSLSGVSRPPVPPGSPLSNQRPESAKVEGEGACGRRPGFIDTQPCAALAETGHELAATTHHPGCCHGASQTIHGDVRDQATFSTAPAGGGAACHPVQPLSDADFGATAPA